MASRPPWSPTLQSGSTNDLITHYFHAGHQYKTILQFLCVVHGVILSIRQLKRKLRHLGLRRRATTSAANLRLVSRLVRVSDSGASFGLITRVLNREKWANLVFSWVTERCGGESGASIKLLCPGSKLISFETHF